MPNGDAIRSRLSARKKDKVYELNGWACAFCGHEDRRPRGEGDLTIDHIVPIGAGGRNAYANLRLLCKPCHRDHHQRQRMLARAA